MKMRAAGFLKKFPNSKVNEGCLMDMGCPECGQRDSFKIEFRGTAEVSDEGSDDVGDHEWDGKSACQCECGHAGTVRDFTFKGLDELI